MTPQRAGQAFFLLLLVSAAALAFPGIDLWVAGLFYDDESARFVERTAFLQFIRSSNKYLVAALLIGLLAAIVVKLIWPRRKMIVSPRLFTFLLIGFFLGPLFTVNMTLKEHWGRPRPSQIVEFGGPSTFQPAWVLSAECPKNCSFASGEASSSAYVASVAIALSGGFSTIPAIVAIGFTIAISLMRMAYGAHFLSDVVIAALLTYLAVWFAYRLVIWRDPAWSRPETLDRVFASWALHWRRETKSFARRWRRRGGQVGDAVRSLTAQR